MAFVIFILQLPPSFPSLPPAGPARPSRLPLVRSRSRSRRPPASAAPVLSIFESGFEIRSFQAASRLDWIEGRVSQIPAFPAACCCPVPSSLLASLNPLHTTSSHTLSPLSPPARPPARPPRRSVLTSPLESRVISDGIVVIRRERHPTPPERCSAVIRAVAPTSACSSFLPPSFSALNFLFFDLPSRSLFPSVLSRLAPPCNLQPWRGRWTRRT